MTTTRDKCIACALANTPASVRVIQIRKSLSGVAHTNPKSPDFGLLCAPRPVTRKALYIFLHECAHFVLGLIAKHRYLEEMECEKWAHARMREAGLLVPRTMTKRAKEYVRYKIIQAANRGCKKFDQGALKFAGLKLKRPLSKKKQAALQQHLQEIMSQPCVMVRFLCPGCGFEAHASVRRCYISEAMIICPKCELLLKPQLVAEPASCRRYEALRGLCEQ